MILLNILKIKSKYIINIAILGLGDSINSIHNRDSALLSSNAIVARLSIRIAHVIHMHA